MDKPKILIVDDEEGIRNQLKWALNKDYTTLLAEDADTASSFVEREKPNPQYSNTFLCAPILHYPNT